MMKNKIVSMIAAGLLVFGVAACNGETAEEDPATDPAMDDDPAADEGLEDDAADS